MARDKHTTHEKAFALNMNRDRYGTVVEIGAGQEVARWFFRVGGAAGTIAKSMPAYDMVARFLEGTSVDPSELVFMAEMTLHSMSLGEEVRHEDFLDRVDTLAELGLDVLITREFKRSNAFEASSCALARESIHRGSRRVE